MRDRFEAAGIVRRKVPPFDRVDGAAQPRRTVDDVGGIQAVPAALQHIQCLHAEDRDILRPDMVTDFDIGAVERADGQRAIERQLHVAGAGGFHPGGRYLLG